MNPGEAEYLLANETLNEIFDQIEKAATERAIYADLADDEKRRIAIEQVRAIRSVREELQARIKAATIPAPVTAI